MPSLTQMMSLLVGLSVRVESASGSLGVSTCHVYSGDRCLVASVVTPAFSQ